MHHCDECGRDVPEYLRRGLCMRCYGRLYQYGAHLDHPRKRRTTAELVDDCAVLAYRGLDEQQMAARLGLSVSRIRTVLRAATAKAS